MFGSSDEIYEFNKEIERLKAELARVRHDVGELLAENGCDCDCEHSYRDHDDDCERCLACRIEAALDSGDANGGA